MTKNVFWDSNIFIAYINNEVTYVEYLRVIEEILMNPDIHIFSSDLALAEISRGKIKQSGTKFFKDFISSFRQKIRLVTPGPNIWINTGELRDFGYKKNDSSRRKLSLGDALMLVTALEISLPPFDIELDTFNTFDAGKGSSTERKGKCIPIIGYEEWVATDNPPELVQKVMKLNRCRPKLPE